MRSKTTIQDHCHMLVQVGEAELEQLPLPPRVLGASNKREQHGQNKKTTYI